MVHAGEKLGVVDHRGVMKAMHLFFAVIVNGLAVDPAPYLGLSQCHAVLGQCTEMLADDDTVQPTWRYAAPGSRG